MSLHINTRKVS